MSFLWERVKGRLRRFLNVLTGRSPWKWPFEDSKRVAVITLKEIIWDGKPILLVTHDEDDGGWQFLDGRDHPKEEDAAIVGLAEMMEHDPTLYELADLPLGWRAWRLAPGTRWYRGPIPPEERA